MKRLHILFITLMLFVTELVLRLVLLVSLVVSCVFWVFIIIICGHKRFGVTLIFAGSHILGVHKAMKEFLDHYNYYAKFR